MQAQECDEDTGQLPFTSGQTSKFAELVAAGQAELPDGLSRAQEAALIREVRVRLRHRLVALVARRIANDIAIEAEPEEMEESNATP